MYIIVAMDRHGKRENVDNARDRVEAEYLREEYALAFGDTFRVTYRHVDGKRRVHA